MQHALGLTVKGLITFSPNLRLSWRNMNLAFLVLSRLGTVRLQIPNAACSIASHGESTIGCISSEFVRKQLVINSR